MLPYNYPLDGIVFVPTFILSEFEIQLTDVEKIKEFILPVFSSIIWVSPHSS